MNLRFGCAFVLGVVLFVSSAVPAAARDWFVSSGIGTGAAPAGKDANPGTLSSPFEHIQKAAERAQPGDRVFVRAGSYRETVIPVRSGAPGKPILFRPYNKESVSLRGTTTIPANAWKKDEAGRWYAVWPAEYKSANNQSDQVFLDGKMIQLARWPHEKNDNLSHPYRARIDSVQSSADTGKKAFGPEYNIYRVTFTDAEFDEPDGRWTGAKFWVNNGNATDTQDGNGITGVVVATDRAKHQITVEVDAGGKIGDQSPDNFQIGKNSEYYLFDPPTNDGLQNANEWRHDLKDNRLYLKLPETADPKNLVLEVKQRDWAFDLSDKSYITVQGFRLFGCSVTTDRESGNGIGNGGGRKNSVAPAHHLVIDNLKCQYVCHFTDQSGNLQTQWDEASGVIVSGSDCVIRNCDIAYSAGCGLVIIGERNKALNNIVHDVGYNATDGGGIGCGVRPYVVSRDLEIAYNTVYNVGIDGIEFGALKNSSLARPGVARIHHNVVHDAVLQSADSGGLHTFSSDGQGTRIDHNIVYSIGGPSNTGYLYFGIYLDYAPDDGRSPANYIVDHNVVYNTPSPLNLNHANTVLILNNTLISATLIARSSISSNGGTYEGVVLKNNLGNTVYRGDLDEDSIRGGKNKAVYERNVITATDALFVDATNPDFAKRDYRLQVSATALINKGADASPWNDATPPDIGAYEFGQPQWKAGATR